MKRYRVTNMCAFPQGDGPWVKFSEANAEIRRLRDLMAEAVKIMKFTGWIGSTQERARIDAFVSEALNSEPTNTGGVCEWDVRSASMDPYNAADYYAPAHGRYFEGISIRQFPHCPCCGKKIRRKETEEVSDGMD